MKDKWKKIMMNSWIVSIGSGLVLAVISVICDLINKERVFSTISGVFTKVGNILVTMLNCRIKVGWLLLGVIVIVCLLVVYIKYLENTTKKCSESDFLEYVQDTVLGYKWRWIWKKDYSVKYYVDDLCPICSRCGTPLIENFYGYGGKYKCLRCEAGYSKILPDFENVKMMISDNVRRKYFSNE